MYEICNLVNLDVDTLNQDSSVNFGNTNTVGGTTIASTVGGSEVIGDFSINFDAEDNNLYSNQQPGSQNQSQSSSQSRQVNQKIVNIVKGKRTTSYASKKKRT